MSGMNFCQHGFLFFFFVISQIAAVCQAPFRYHTISRTYNIPYIINSGFQENYGNDILEELAKDLLKPPHLVNITVGFREELILQPETPQKYKVCIILSEFRLSGDLSYRAFPFGDLLIPSGMSFSLKVAAKIDTNECTRRPFGPTGVRWNDKLVFIADSVAADTAADTLVSGDFRFSYNGNDWLRFYERKSLTDDYYASAAMLDSLDLEAAGWNMTDQQGLPFNYIRLSELVRFLAFVSDRRFDSSLTGDGRDPKQLSLKYLRLYKISRTCLYNFTETLEKSGLIAGYKSTGSVSDYFVSRLSRFIRLSSLLENINGMIYHDYLASYYNYQAMADEPGIVRSMLIMMFPDANRDTLLAWASESLMGAFRRKAKELDSTKRYSEASLLLENARNMVRKNPYLKQRNGLDDLISESVNGIYASFAGIASSSFDAGNTRLAMDYLSKAEKYREQHPALITSDTTYRRVYRAILLGRMGLCDRLLENGNFADALDCLKAFERSYSGTSAEVLSEDLDEKMNRARTGIIMVLLGNTSKALKLNEPDSVLEFYNQANIILNEMPENKRIIPGFDSLASKVAIIRFGKMNTLAEAYFNRRQFARAVVQFEEASELAKSHDLPSDQIADSLYKASYKQWLLEQISGEQRLVWTNKPDSAGSFIALVLETAASKGLSDDPDILKAVSSYRLLMKNQVCLLLEDSINLLTIRAGKCFAIRNFSRGAGMLEKAIQLAGQSPWCNLDTRLIRDTLAYYDAAAIYQKMNAAAEFSIAAGEFDYGIRILAMNEKYYASGRIDNFGIPFISMYDFVLKKGNPFLSAKALDYWIFNNNPGEAFRYLLLMQVQGLTVDRSIPYQEKLARLMAARDKLVYPRTDPQSLLKQYTSSNPWMNRFSSVYLMEWNK